MRTLISNVGLLLIAKAINTGLSLGAFVLIARTLSVAETGLYALLLTWSSLLVVIVSWGGNDFLFRRGAVREARLGVMLTATDVMRLGAGLPAAILIGVSIAAWRGDATIALLLPLAALTAIVDSQTVARIVAFRAKGNVRFEPWFYAGRGLLKLVLVGAACTWIGNLSAIFSAILIAHLGGLAATARFGRVVRGRRPHFRYVLRFAVASTPYLVTGLLGTLSLQIDILMIGALSTDHELGMFSVGMQLLNALVVIPMALHVVVQPELVRAFERDKLLWKKQVRVVLGISAISAVVVCLPLVTVAGPLAILVLSPKYSEAQEIIQILMLAFSVRMVSSIALLPAYTSAKRLGEWNKLLWIALFFHALINLLLLPTFGGLGAALGLVTTELFMSVVAYRRLLPSIRASD